MYDANDKARAEAACGYLACYLRLAKLKGRVAVVRSTRGLALGVTLEQLSQDAMARVPPAVDGFNVKVLV